MSRPLRPLARVAVAASLALSPLALAACGDDDSQPDAAEETVEQDDGGLDDAIEGEPGVRYEGAYDSQFYGELDVYLGQEVAVSAGVEAVPDPAAVVIAGVADSGVPALLVLAPTGTEGLEAGMEIEVAGTVQDSFSESAAADLGIDVDGEDLAPFEGEPFIVADTVGDVVDAG